MKEKIELDIHEELLEEAKECAEKRDFENLEHFVNSSIRDAVRAEDPYTEQARQQISEAREAYKNGEAVSFGKLIDEVGDVDTT